MEKRKIMKVLLVNGSPHKEGSTYTCLSEIAKTLNNENIETEIIQIGIDPIASCRGCGACNKLKKCVIDDKVNEFIEKAKTADGFIFGSPVHYSGPYGNLVSFMNRVFFAGSRADSEIFRLKPAASISCARRAGAVSTFDQLNKFFTISEMPIISSRYWNMAFGSNAEDVKKDLEGMQTMRILAKNMAYHLKCKEAAKQAGILPPKKEDVTYTNFIR